MAIRYFLGANSSSGFVSLFDDWIGAADTDKVYIIKGTPGSGKSSFMRKVAAVIEDKGEAAEYICCSADPDSLDGVRFPGLGTLIVDGTAPHVIEPRLPYAVESYLNLGEFIDGGGVRQQKEKLSQVIGEHRQSAARTARCISAAAAMQENIHSIVASGEILEKVARRAKGVVRREISKGPGAVLRKRYLNALSPQGETVYWDTVSEQCQKVYTLDNSFGFSPYFLSPILTAALEAGQEAVACYNPLDNKLEHLILPTLSLGFVSIKPGRSYPGKTYRHIRLDAIVPVEHIRGARQKLRFLQKTQASILREASFSMGQSKALHDEIEDIYVPNVDFSRLYSLSDDVATVLSRKLDEKTES